MKSKSIISALIFAMCGTVGCGISQTTASSINPTPTDNAPVSSPSPSQINTENDANKVPHIGAKPLNGPQRKELDRTLPRKVRYILEEADDLQVLGLSSDEKAGIGWYPDRVVNIPKGPERTELLKNFYFDASAGPNPSACFIPRHGLKASYKGKTVEVIICYQCHLFVVKGDLGEFDGGVYFDGSAAHDQFVQLIKTRGQPTQ